MINRSIRTYSSKKFTWTGNVGVAEMSDFGTMDPLAICDRIYDDACDCGFAVESVVTGKRIVFNYSHAINSGENEIQAHVLVSLDDKCRRADGKYEIHLLND
jgi:hypothetical protein